MALDMLELITFRQKLEGRKKVSRAYSHLKVARDERQLARVVLKAFTLSLRVNNSPTTSRRRENNFPMLKGNDLDKQANLF
jgi:hypothetical protein